MPQKAPHSSSPESSVPSRLARPAPPPAMLPGTGLPLRLWVTNGGVTARRGGTPTGMWVGSTPQGAWPNCPLSPGTPPMHRHPPCARVPPHTHLPAAGPRATAAEFGPGARPRCARTAAPHAPAVISQGHPWAPPGAAGTDRRWSPLRSTAPPPPPPRLISPQHPVPGSCHLPWGPGTAPGDIGMLLSTWGQ